MNSYKHYENQDEILTAKELCKAFLFLKDQEEVYRFLKDLCTPQEIKALSERWKVCRLLDQGQLSYRDISQRMGASLATIGRVARFLHNESYHGYNLVLERMKQDDMIKK